MQNEIDLCDDDDLAYVRSKTNLTPGEGMLLDEGYRLAHLPLVAPDSPLVIPTRPGSHYDMGRHPRVFSVVLPIAAEALESSAAYRELERDLVTSPLAHKIAWHVVGLRRERLHATLCGGLGIEVAPVLDRGLREALAAIGPFVVDVRGLFSGNINRGRLYVRIYPERRHGQNMLHAVQMTLGRPTKDLYVAGVWNLTDNLTAAEAGALSSLVERWWNRSIIRFEVNCLWLLGACDDLVLDGSVEEVLYLT